MILAYYGMTASEKAIGRRAKTTVSCGTSPENIVVAAQSFGLEGRWKKNATINDLRKSFDKGVPVIVSWISEDELHYSVVVGVDDRRVVLLDPETAKRRIFDHERFMRIWLDFPMPWIQKSSQLRIRWMLPLTPRKNRPWEEREN